MNVWFFVFNVSVSICVRPDLTSPLISSLLFLSSLPQHLCLLFSRPHLVFLFVCFFSMRFNRTDAFRLVWKKKKKPPPSATTCIARRCVCNGPLNFIEILKFNDDASLYFKSPVFLSGCTWLPPARLHLGSRCVFSGRLEEFYAAALC